MIMRFNIDKYEPYYDRMFNSGVIKSTEIQISLNGYPKWRYTSTNVSHDKDSNELGIYIPNNDYVNNNGEVMKLGIITPLFDVHIDDNDEYIIGDFVRFNVKLISISEYRISKLSKLSSVLNFD